MIASTSSTHPPQKDAVDTHVSTIPPFFSGCIEAFVTELQHFSSTVYVYRLATAGCAVSKQSHAVVKDNHKNTEGAKRLKQLWSGIISRNENPTQPVEMFHVNA